MKNSLRIIATLASLLVSIIASADKLDSLKMNKFATPNGDGTYTLTLDTYVIGDYSEETQVVTTTNPVDFVLCLDISGSMAEPLKDNDRIARWGLISGDGTKKLDKDKGKIEGYYSCVNKALGFIEWGYTPMRYVESEQKWQLYRNDSWADISDYWINGIDLYKSKMGSLMDACDVFLNKIEASQREGSLNGSNGHKVGVVTFSNEAKVLKGLTSINSKADISSAIHTLWASGATAADYGLNAARTMLSLNASGNGRSKVLVLFTDGEPNHGSGFDTKVANDCITIAKDIKSKNAKVFSINVYSTTSGSNMWKYMNYVSSNYPGASSLTNAGAEASNKYYHMATNESALNAAFESVATESMSRAGGAGIQLNVSEVTLRDVVTPSFILPKDADGNYRIRIYEVPVITTTVPSSHKIDDIKFATLTEAEKSISPANVSVSVDVDEETGKSTIDVQGFDFSSKWIGYKHIKKGGSVTWSVNPGSKLTIEIIISPNPEKDGGHVDTNDPASGVYVGTESITPAKEYPVPDVYTPKNLIIKTETQSLSQGKGESMLFRITRNDDPSFQMTIAMTEGGDDTKVIAQLPVKDKDNNDITYTVTPLNSWSWAYQDVSAKSQVLLENNVFTFTPQSVGVTKKHAEDSRNNVFLKR